MSLFLLLLALFLLMNPVPTKATDTEEPRVGIHGLRLPATFVGDLPCGDCPGIRHQVNVWPDQVFYLRRTWLEKDHQVDAMGRWSVDPDRQTLILRDGTETPAQFKIQSATVLRQLDTRGKPIESDLPDELAAKETLQPLLLQLNLHGMFTYLADAALFTECLTDRSYSVAMEGDFAALQRAYMEKRAEPGAPLMATFEGQITDRPAMEGDTPVPLIVVDRFVNVWPLERCERWKSEPTLRNTYWKITRLHDVDIAVVKNHREPHILLSAQQDRFRATMGCNQLIGGYEAEDAGAISFQAGPTTLMACPPPLDKYERDLVEILQVTRGYRMSGQTMELFDGDDRAVALLQAVYF